MVKGRNSIVKSVRMPDKLWKDFKVTLEKEEKTFSEKMNEWIETYLLKKGSVNAMDFSSLSKNASVNTITETVSTMNPKDKMTELRGIIRGIENKPSIPQEITPTYDPQKHKPGDTVRVKRGTRWHTITIPNLDAEGNSIPE